MKLSALSTFLTLVAINISSTYATENRQSEIDHLIHFVSNSNCRFIRNGEVHNGKDAAEHIEKKYRYFKSNIDSTEKFIELTATQSMISKKKYTIICPGTTEMESQQWLLKELRRKRKSDVK